MLPANLLLRSCVLFLGIFYVADSLRLISQVDAAESDRIVRAESQFASEIKPLLQARCYDCHANGSHEGGVSLDEIDTEHLLSDQKLWARMLRMVRADMMPPDGESLNREEKLLLAGFVKRDILDLSPDSLDPGSVTIRRLNRSEYRNTIRDLLNFDFKVEENFPVDDSGHGFDNIANVQTLSPILLEKYIAAASTIVDQVVPKIRWIEPQTIIAGKSFTVNEGSAKASDDSLRMSYYDTARASAVHLIDISGNYRLAIQLSLGEQYVDNVFDYNKCEFTCLLDGEIISKEEFSRENDKKRQIEFDRWLEAGEHKIEVLVKPTTSEDKVRDLRLEVRRVQITGPFGDEYLVHPKGYEVVFAESIPESPDEQRAYMRRLLEPFASRAFRRPVDSAYLDRLVEFAIANSLQPNANFESGYAAGLVAILSSPRFLFLEEQPSEVVLEANHSAAPEQEIKALDDYALASRLSYFLWSSMPDDQLIRLASEGKLRSNLVPQVDRMLKDWRSDAFNKNFVGQWLRSRDIETANVNASATLARDAEPDPDAERARDRFRELRRKNPDELSAEEKTEMDAMRAKFLNGFRRFREFELDYSLRNAMRQETEMMFDYVIDENRSLLELIDADYTFLNERLARHYNIDGVQGREMRRVELAEDSPRGGILTQGTFLIVTSNPDRTSPVKRGLFVLENLLGTPPPPPPPNIPSLEDSLDGRDPKSLSLRETLEIHRQDAACAGCHNRMDPLGLGLENFNALGMWREKERSDVIQPEGTLITGESFATVQQLKSILKEDRREQFFSTVSEKMLTYALGRGLEPYDIETVDRIVERLEQANGASKELIYAIVESAPFGYTRTDAPDS